MSIRRMRLFTTVLLSCICWLSDGLDCTQRILVDERRPFTGKAPDRMPEDLAQAYTRCGTVGTASYYVDDTNNGKRSHYKFSNKEINKWIEGANKLASMPKPAAIGKRGWLAESLARRRKELIGKSVLVFGSTQPIVETLLIAFGVANVTTVEYNLLTYSHPQITTMTPDQLDAWVGGAAGLDRRFDIALSISSFDHDGLGRYGDPLCPDGDLLSNDAVRDRYLKPGGLYFLTVPIGPDLVIWNLMRRYGPIRLPLLLDGWTEVERIGWSDDLMTTNVSFTQTTEPVFVLKSPAGATTTIDSGVEKADPAHATSAAPVDVADGERDL